MLNSPKKNASSSNSNSNAVKKLTEKFERHDPAVCNATKVRVAHETSADAQLASADVKRTMFHFDEFKPKVWDEKKDNKTAFPAKKIQHAKHKAQALKQPNASLATAEEAASLRAIQEILANEGQETVLLNLRY